MFKKSTGTIVAANFSWKNPPKSSSDFHQTDNLLFLVVVVVVFFYFFFIFYYGIVKVRGINLFFVFLNLNLEVVFFYIFRSFYWIYIHTHTHIYIYIYIYLMLQNILNIINIYLTHFVFKKKSQNKYLYIYKSWTQRWSIYIYA